MFVLAFVLSHISLLPHHPTLNPKHNVTAHSQQQPPSFVTISYAPECLVAFAFAERWLDREPGNRHDDRSQSSRLYSILDSLASICVCKGKGEVYAIAIQLQEDGSAGSITLTVAGNNVVPKEVSSHLRKGWQQLQQIAQSCYKFYSGHGQKYLFQYAEQSPPADDALAAAEPLVSQLLVVLYNTLLRNSLVA